VSIQKSRDHAIPKNCAAAPRVLARRLAADFHYKVDSLFLFLGRLAGLFNGLMRDWRAFLFAFGFSHDPESVRPPGKTEALIVRMFATGRRNGLVKDKAQRRVAFSTRLDEA
jgi:hypothetical protein